MKLIESWTELDSNSLSLLIETYLLGFLKNLTDDHARSVEKQTEKS